ncbi:MAG: hypothetical protein A3K10_04010, partial [Bacteroidetes bacterium RIFCSPLOWO2_12_FULL_31_6]
ALLNDGISSKGIPDYKTLGISESLGLFLDMLPFLIGIITLFISHKFINKQPIQTLISSNSNCIISWGKILKLIPLYFLLASLVELSLCLLGYSTYKFNPNISVTALISFIFLVPIAPLFEELFHRGYLFQGLSILTKNKIFALIFISLFLGALHAGTSTVNEDGYITIIYFIGMGFILWYFAMKSKSIIVPLGMHIGNNLFSSLLASKANDHSLLINTNSITNPILNMVTWMIPPILFLLLCKI